MHNKPEDYPFDRLYSKDLSDAQLKKFLLRHVSVDELCRWHERLHLVLDEIIEHLDIPQGARYLDLGCQIGTFAIELASRGQNATGVDLSEDALDVARIMAGKLGLSNEPEFVKGDISDPGIFPEASFDVILAEDIFEHLHQDLLAKTIENCERWLRPGGYLIYHTYPTKYDYLFHARGWKAALSLFPLALVSLMHGERKFKRAVERYHARVMNPLSKLKTGQTHEERILRNPHCNLLTVAEIEHMIANTKLVSVAAKTKNMYVEDRTRFPLRSKIFGKREYFHRNIYGIAWKPYAELLTR